MNLGLKEKISISDIDTFNYENFADGKKTNYQKTKDSLYLSLNKKVNQDISIINTKNNNECNYKIIYEKNDFENEENENNKKHIYFYDNLDVSNIKIILSMTSQNIQRFLGKYLKISGFIAGMISHIIKNNENKINLKGTNIENYNGSFSETISTIINCYRQSTFKIFVGLSAKGILGGFFNFFKNDITNIKNNYLLRNRIPRALYGNFSSIRKYDAIDAYTIDMINNTKIIINEKKIDSKNIKFLKCEKIQQDNNKEYFILITTKNFIIYNKLNEKCEEVFDLDYIEKVNLLEEYIVHIIFDKSFKEVNYLHEIINFFHLLIFFFIY